MTWPTDFLHIDTYKNKHTGSTLLRTLQSQTYNLWTEYFLMNISVRVLFSSPKVLNLCDLGLETSCRSATSSPAKACAYALQGKLLPAHLVLLLCFHADDLPSLSFSDHSFWRVHVHAGSLSVGSAVPPYFCDPMAPWLCGCMHTSRQTLDWKGGNQVTLARYEVQ